MKVAEPRIAGTFEIYKNWKGISHKKLILKTFYNKYTMKGYCFKEGMERIVFAYKQDNDSLDTDMCSIFTINDKEILQELHKLIK